MKTVKQFAARKRISVARVHHLIGQGRIPGAARFGPLWVVPDRARIVPPLKVKHRRKAHDTRKGER
jgi:hypothetical protein